ncbi:MAG: nucleotidyltransferase family protein [Nitrospirota bacterium]
MKAMILAAGLGTRLRPITNNTPKPIIPVGDRPLIEYLLLLLKKYGIKDIIINLHHLGEKIENALGDGSRWGIRISYSREEIILGTGGGIKKAQAFLSDSAFLVINGDILIDINIDNLLEFHQRHGGIATMVLRENDNPDLYGSVKIDKDQRVRQILDRPVCTVMDLNSYMFTGIHLIEPKIFQYIPEGQYYSVIDAYIEMLTKNEVVYGHIMKGHWSDIGTIEGYEKVSDDNRRGVIRLSYL